MQLMLDLSIMLLFGLLWLGVVTFLRLKKKKSVTYLLFFTVFYVYLFKVLDYTLLQFQTLVLLRHLMPNLMLNGQAAGEWANLIPLITLGLGDLKTSLLNVLLMVPFGFGLPFITDLRMRKVVLVGLLFSVCIELAQLLTGLVAGITFRVADVNDVLFNTVGVAIGYVLFVGFFHVFRSVLPDRKVMAHPVLRYIAERPQMDVRR